MSKLNLNDLLQEKMTEIVERLVGNEILIRVILGEDIRDIDADERDIEQLILTLAIKARREMPKGSQLIISTGNVSMTHDEEQSARQAGLAHYVKISFFYDYGGFREKTDTDISGSQANYREELKETLLKIYKIVERFDGYLNVHHHDGKTMSLNVLIPVYPNVQRNLRHS